MKGIPTSCILLALAWLAGCTSHPIDISLTQETLQPATASPLPSPSSTPDLALTQPETGFAIQSYCPEVTLDTSNLPELPGTLVLSGDKMVVDGEVFVPEAGSNSLLLFWNGQSDRKTSYQLPKPHIYYYHVTSPDKSKLAFTEGKTTTIEFETIVLDQNGKETGRFTLPDDWTLFDWLNNEILLVRQLRLPGANIELIAIDPDNGNRQFLPADFPDLYSREAFLGWGALTIFDPTASYVLYPIRPEGNEVISVLWDVHNNKEIVRIAGGQWPIWARWSPDGKQLLLVIDLESTPAGLEHHEIFLMNLQGELIQSTFFNDQFERDLIASPVWSPNGRYVAFWLGIDLPFRSARLAVLDIETSVIALHCKEFNPYPFRFGSLPSTPNVLGYADVQVNSAPPIWSPDGKYLLIEDYRDFKSSTYLLDFSSRSIIKIAEGARPVGWLQ
jgi:hypothetical protein